MEDHLVWLNLKNGNADAVDALMRKYYADYTITASNCPLTRP
jgi:hypothetical protein